jgi:hypothetical protein
MLDAVVAGARAGQSQVLVVQGEAGIGKTVLLDYLETNAAGCRIARSAGAEAEMELAYAGLHQFCAPLLDRLDRLPDPQRIALSTAFGLIGGDAPDRFMVGLAVLDLLADGAEQQPLICIIDDAQWLDHVSTKTVAFCGTAAGSSGNCVACARCQARRSVASPSGSAAATTRLDSVVKRPMDPRVRDRIIAETRGNPLALLELPRPFTAAELADGVRAIEPGPVGPPHRGGLSPACVEAAAERIAVVVAIREPSDADDFVGLPELTIKGLIGTDSASSPSPVIHRHRPAELSTVR